MQSEIEQRAEAVLAAVPDWLWNGETLPVPVEHIADTCFGLYVREAEDLRTAPGVPVVEETKGLSGLLLPSLGEIWVNAGEAREWPGRRRFTISHELGHWCLHRTDGAVWCRKHAVDPPDGDAPPSGRTPAGGGRGRRVRRGAADAGRPGTPPLRAPAPPRRSLPAALCGLRGLRLGDGPAAAPRGLTAAD